MKKNALVLLIISLVLSSAVHGQKGQTDKKPAKKKVVEVLYFHYAHRCATCNAVEEETLKSLKELYPTQVKEGTLSFQSVNLEETEGEKLANKHMVDSQSLIITSGGKKEDLTEKAFLYARNSPDKLKAEIKKTADKFLH